MSTRTIDELPPATVLNDSFIAFANAVGLTNNVAALILANLSNGSASVLITQESDLPPFIDGFRTLEQNKNYIFTEPATFTNPILIPAGWTGSIRTSFFTPDSISYTGTGSFFSTLDIDGIINSIADAGGGFITVTTSASHGLLDNQFVNITGTVVETDYIQSRLQISNVTATTFDVELPFTATDTGLFNTGHGSLMFTDFSVTNPFTADFVDLTSSEGIGSSLIFIRCGTAGFVSPGTIRKTQNLLTNACIFGFIIEGLIIENVVAANFTTTNFLSLNPAIASAIGLEIRGVGTKKISVVNCSFDMTNSFQEPVRIDPDVTNADEIIFSRSPDNLVADDYFDTAAGGLDQTNPQVIADNNGTRPNSMTLAESSSAGILVVDGSGEIDVPIVDITPMAGDWVEDPTTETFSVNTTDGIITYNGLNPITVMVKYSLSIAQTSGPAQTVEIDLHINGTVQPKSGITIITVGTSNFVPGVYNGGNFLIQPGDTFQLFKDNTSNDNDTSVQNAILLINID